MNWQLEPLVANNNAACVPHTTRTCNTQTAVSLTSPVPLHSLLTLVCCLSSLLAEQPDESSSIMFGLNLVKAAADALLARMLPT
jgi:hypothetical protein